MPEVLNQNDDLSEEFYEILEDENLEDAQQAKLEKQFASELEIIKRDDRLDTIAGDIVYHFPRRGYLGKGMVITVDKFTAVEMYDKVQRLWKEEIKALRGRIKQSKDELQNARWKRRIDWMRKVEMAVVVSAENGEEERFDKEHLDVRPHRQKDEWRKSFSVYENAITGLFEASKPEILGKPVVRTVAAFQYLRGVIDSIIQQQDIESAARKIGNLLDESVIVDKSGLHIADEAGTTYRIQRSTKVWDLSKIDFDKLRKEFKQTTCKHIEIADLRAFLEKKLAQMLNQNLPAATLRSVFKKSSTNTTQAPPQPMPCSKNSWPLPKISRRRMSGTSAKVLPS